MQISGRVMKILKAEGISTEELYHMVEHAAMCSIRGCSRRYYQWVFWLGNDSLKDMQHAEPLTVGEGEARMMETHEGCGGDGCRECGWIGEFSRGIQDGTAESLEGR